MLNYANDNLACPLSSNIPRAPIRICINLTQESRSTNDKRHKDIVKLDSLYGQGDENRPQITIGVTEQLNR